MRLLPFGLLESLGQSEEPTQCAAVSGCLLWLGDDSKVRLRRLPAIRVFLLGFLVRHCRHDDHILAVLPIYWSCHLVGSRELYRIEDPQNFVKVAACGHRVNQHQLDLLVRADQEHRAYCGVVRGCAALGGGSRIARQHVIELCHLEFRVTDQRVVHSVALSLFDVCCPPSVTAYRVDAQPDNLAVSLCEFGLQAGHVAEFGGANGSKVLRMRKQDGPAIADPFVEGYGTLGRLRREIRGYIVYA
jgi:hypothetical protein